jgi:hypothetical protein
MKRILVIFTILAGATLSITAPAFAQPAPVTGGPGFSYASKATAYQNKVIDRALARVPGGTRISASEAKWPDGVLIAVPVHSDQNELADCLSYTASSDIPDFCGFTDADYDGDYISAPEADLWYMANYAPYWVPWGEYFGTGMHSFYNSTLTRVWREQFQNSGNLLCIDPVGGTGGGNDYYNTNYNGPDVNDWWVYMSVNYSNCP